MLRYVASALVVPLILAAVSGCPLSGARNRPQVPGTRPNPTKPAGRQSETPLQPSPTKKLPGVSAVDAEQLKASCDRILRALNQKDWKKATQETNSLGALWTRFKPAKRGTMSATEMKNFDVRYASLQKEVRAKNRNGAIRTTRALKDTVAKMKS